MTSNFIPYLPSSPPPLNDDEEVEDDDEFGSFTIANHLCNDKVTDNIPSIVREKHTNEGCTESANEDQSLPSVNNSVLTKQKGTCVNLFEFESHNNNKSDVNGTNGEDEVDDDGISADAAYSQPSTSRCNIVEENNSDTEKYVSKESDNERTKETLNCDDQSDEFGSFIISSELSDYSTLYQNDSVTDFNDDLPHVFPKSDADIPDLVFTKPEVEKEPDNLNETFNESVDIDDSSNSEWLGFVAVSHTAPADDEDDEFSDFVSPPSDDTFQTAQKHESKSDEGEKNTDFYFNCDSTNVDSRRNETDQFQAHFEAHFDDNETADSIPSISITIPQATKIVHNSFVTNSMIHEEVIESLDKYSKTSAGSEDTSLNCNIWSHICDTEKTDALSYQWNNSSCNKKLLRAINIDSRNLLFGHNWNSSVPLFAANLSLNPLEPMKTPLKTNDVTEDKESIAPSPQELIPPAQFDWNSSGLINPLDASNGASTLLDLDFFFTNETGSVNPVPATTWSLENELLGSDTTDLDINCTEHSAKVSPLLEQILSSAKFSASNFTQTKASTSLSHEAQLVLNKLPDLRFMQAKVLMFPIRSSTP